MKVEFAYLIFDIINYDTIAFYNGQTPVVEKSPSPMAECTALNNNLSNRDAFDRNGYLQHALFHSSPYYDIHRFFGHNWVNLTKEAYFYENRLLTCLQKELRIKIISSKRWGSLR